MSAPVRKQAESEFDDLLGDLVNELAMAPPAESAITLIPEEPEPPAMRVDSTQDMASAAAAAAAANHQGSRDGIKIFGIIAGSLTALGVTALLVFGGGEEPEVAQAPDADAIMASAKLASMQAAGEEAKRDLQVAIAAKRQVLEAEAAADAAALAKAKAEAEAAAEAEKKKNKPRKPRKPRKPKPKPPAGDDFDDL